MKKNVILRLIQPLAVETTYALCLKVQSYHTEPIMARKVVLEFSRETEPRRKKKGRGGGERKKEALYFFSCSFTKHYGELLIKTWLTMTVESDKFQDLWLTNWGPML